MQQKYNNSRKTKIIIRTEIRNNLTRAIKI